MLAIILGINGQDGQYLMQLLREKQIKVIGFSRTSKQKADVASYSDVELIVKEYKPDYIFHLAANSTTSHNALFENHETISTGTLNILEAVCQHSRHTKVFITGSGVQFKNIGEPISEKTEFEGNSPYSIARIQSVYAARYYRSLGIKVYVGYLFHHVSKKIAETVKQIKKGNNEILEIGDIKVQKEWTFAGDVVNAIFCLMNQDHIFETVIGSGKTYSIENWLELCFSLVNLNWKEHVKISTDFTPEYKCLISDPSTINHLGWKPEVDFNQLATLMLKHD